MARITYSNNTFRCHIDCERCDHIKPNNQRCRNRVCFGVPTCWIHSKQKYKVKTKPSATHGTGLFSTEEIPSDTWICPYVGQNINAQCLNLRYPGNTTATYAVGTSNNWSVDSACRRGIGAMANGKFRANGQSQALNRHNAVIVSRRGQGLWLKSTRRIPENREIFVFYGEDYILEADHTTKRTKLNDNRPC